MDFSLGICNEGFQPFRNTPMSSQPDEDSPVTETLITAKDEHKDGPLLEAGQPAPGRFKTVDGKLYSTWEGEIHTWRVRHGEAVMTWSFGNPDGAKNVRMPDGTRRDAETMMHFEGPRKWRVLDGRRWTHGVLEESADELTFAPDAVQPPERKLRPEPDDKPNMEREMMASATLRAQVDQDDFAYALYAAMCNVDWRKSDSDCRWNCSWRYAGGVVAGLRGLGEDYMDFYCGGNEGQVAPKVMATLHELGWNPLTEEEILVDRERARVILLEWMAKPFPVKRIGWLSNQMESMARLTKKDVPPHVDVELPEGNEMMELAIWCHTTSRIESQKEWLEFCELS